MSSKFHSIRQSHLFQMKSKGKLATFLGFTSVSELEKLANNTAQNYSFFEIRQGNKSRKIQNPKTALKYVQKKITKVISRIEAPRYLHSGIKGSSYLSNAKSHVFTKDPNRVATMDIRSFFQSTSYKRVWSFFLYKMQCSRDVSSVLTKLLIVDGHLPTGSSHSVIMSFYAYKDMFDKIYGLCKGQGIIMTCYVDDLSFSGSNVNKSLVKKVSSIVASYGLQIHPGKTRLCSSKCSKEITGVAITPQGIRLPNKRRKIIHEQVVEYRKLKQSGQSVDHIEKQLFGRLGEASQIEKRFLPLIESLKKLNA